MVILYTDMIVLSLALLHDTLLCVIYTHKMHGTRSGGY